MSCVVSILIPSYKTRDLSVQCIRSILENPPTVAYEIVLMDNNSGDGTYEEITRQFPSVRVMRNDVNLGVGQAFNSTPKEATGKAFLILNNDAKPMAGAIDRLVQWLETHPKSGIVGPELLGEGGALLQMSWGWYPVLTGELLQRFFNPSALQKSPFRQRWVRHLQQKSRRVPWICGACALIRREAFEAVAGFDEDFKLYFEDSDLCQRLTTHGWHNDYVAEAKAVHHLSQATRPAMSEFSLIYLQSHILYYRKHAPFWGVWLLKGYLLLKWFIGRYGTRFLQVVLEKQEISLPRGAEPAC